MLYAIVRDNEIKRINITLPTSIGNTYIPRGGAHPDLYPIVGDEPPHNPVTERVTGPRYEIDGQAVRRVYSIEPLDIWPMADSKLQRINDGKNAALDGGFTHDGILFDSDSKARLAYLELSLKLGQDSAYSTPWKASTGAWVTMDAALFAALQPAYEAHIAVCFAWQAAREAEVAAAVAAGDVEALRAVDEVMV